MAMGVTGDPAMNLARLTGELRAVRCPFDLDEAGCAPARAPRRAPRPGGAGQGGRAMADRRPPS